MQSMYGKFPLANRPKMTRRKRKNMNLAPGASSTTSRGGNSPTTEPTNDPAGAPSSTTQSPRTSLSGSGAHRTTRRTHQARKRGGNPYNWLPPNDYPSSPTTDETLPITPRSDMSSTFSVSPSPRPSFRQPRQSQSPVHERRNAVSAGPDNTDFVFLPGTEPQYFAPASAPLLTSTPTWPLSTAEQTQRYPEPASNGLVHTQSDGALRHISQGSDQHANTEYGQPLLGASQITLSCHPNQRPYLTNYATLNHQPNHSFDPFSTRIDPSLTEQTLWPNFQPNYPSNSVGEQQPGTPSDSLNLESPGLFTGFPEAPPATYNGPYSNVDEANQMHFFNFPNTYTSSLMLDSNANSHLQGTSPIPRSVAQPSQQQLSLANLAFGPPPNPMN